MQFSSHCWRRKNEIVSQLLLWEPNTADAHWPTRVWQGSYEKGSLTCHGQQTGMGQTCCMLLHTIACCLELLREVWKPVKLLSQQLPTFLLFGDRRNVAQQCWIRLHSSYNIVRATHPHYTWFTKTYGLYPSHDALQVPTLFGVILSVYK